MKISSNLRETTRGGQVFMHTITMYGQIMKSMGVAALAAAILFNVLWFFVANTSENREILTYYLSAEVKQLFDEKSTLQINGSDNKSYPVYTTDYIASPAIQSAITDVKVISSIGGILSFGVWVATFVLAGSFFRRRGKEVLKDKNINGHKVVEPEVVNKQLKSEGKKSDLKIGDLHLVKDSEKRHLLALGTTGAGKSEVIKGLLKQIIARGDKFIVFDKSCDLTNEFFDSSRDALLNVFDERCAGWDIWSDARDQADLAAMAEALIPPSKTESAFFIRAARKVFECTAALMKSEPDRSSIKLMRKLLTSELSSIHSYLKDTEAATLVDTTAEKTSSNIKSEMAAYLSSLKYLHDGGKPFSIREFVKDENDKQQGLFITSLSDKHHVIKPLITLWLDIAMHAIMSLAPNPERRIWIILDECHSLHNLPILPTAANEIRKFGGCLVIGTTSYAGIKDLYGRDCAEGIFAQINTSVIFTSPTHEASTWASRQLGESEIDEVIESYSYGAHPMRDGISINTRRIRRPAVTPTDIERLGDYQAYIKLTGSYPIAHVKFKPNHFKREKEPGFIAREFNTKAVMQAQELEDSVRNEPAKKEVSLVIDEEVMSDKQLESGEKTLVTTSAHEEEMVF